MEKNINIHEKDLNIKKILEEGSNSPIEELIALKVLLDDEIARCECHAKFLDEAIKSLDYEENMLSRGLIEKGDKVEIDVATKYGDTIAVSVSKGVEKNFNIDALKEKKTMDSIVPDKYKKTSILLDKKKIETDYEAGTLSEEMRSLIKNAPRLITKIRKTLKGEKI